jgi:hypothetical protein
MLLMLRTATCVALLLGVAGCASITHYNKQRKLSANDKDSHVLAMDAKQRTVLATRVEEDAKLEITRFCAEPSPDALSALAASGGASLSKEEKLALGSNFAIAEAAGSIGLRTQSIQLMRDAMYRICEGYLSGALDPAAFETMHRRFQSSMVAILAIEQITGVVRPPTVVLGGTSSAGSAERAAELTQKTEQALISLRAAEDAVKGRQSELAAATKLREDLEKESGGLVAEGVDKFKEPPPLTDDQKKKRARLEALRTELTAAAKAESEKKSAAADAERLARDRKAAHEALDSARMVALAGGGAAAAVARVDQSASAPSDKAVEAVGTAVSTIVADTLTLSFTRELCVTTLLKNPPAVLSGSLYEKCVAYLDETVKALAVENDFYRQVAANLSNSAIAGQRLLAALPANPSTAQAEKAAAELRSSQQELIESLNRLNKQKKRDGGVLMNVE